MIYKDTSINKSLTLFNPPKPGEGQDLSWGGDSNKIQIYTRKTVLLCLDIKH